MENKHVIVKVADEQTVAAIINVGVIDNSTKKEALTHFITPKLLQAMSEHLNTETIKVKNVQIQSLDTPLKLTASIDIEDGDVSYSMYVYMEEVPVY